MVKAAPRRSPGDGGSGGGVEDLRYQEFGAWLRDVRKEFPSGKGWAGLYLEEAGGDHRAAIMRFLERCAEYDAMTRGRST
jgi:hypothetical protein